MKRINDTSDMCPECTGSGMSCGEACHLCWGSGKYSGNSRMLDIPTKPTYEEQLAWLDLVGLMATPNDKEMIKAIKENVIIVRNQESVDKILEGYKKATQDVVMYKKIMLDEIAPVVELSEAEAVVRQQKIETQLFVKELSSVEALPEDLDPVPVHKGGLNYREQLLLDNRIKQLQGELQAQLSLKKQFRSKQAIDHCHTAINNLKKWKSQSL